MRRSRSGSKVSVHRWSHLIALLEDHQRRAHHRSCLDLLVKEQMSLKDRGSVLMREYRSRMTDARRDHRRPYAAEQHRLPRTCGRRVRLQPSRYQQRLSQNQMRPQHRRYRDRQDRSRRPGYQRLDLELSSTKNRGRQRWRRGLRQYLQNIGRSGTDRLAVAGTVRMAH